MLFYYFIDNNKNIKIDNKNKIGNLNYIIITYLNKDLNKNNKILNKESEIKEDLGKYCEILFTYDFEKDGEYILIFHTLLSSTKKCSLIVPL